MIYTNFSVKSDVYVYTNSSKEFVTHVAVKKNLPFSGEIFRDKNKKDCKERLTAMRTFGYLIPQEVIDKLT